MFFSSVGTNVRYKKTTVPTPLTMEAPVSIVSSLVSAIFTDKIW